MTKTILVVDDDSRMRHLISYYLNLEGFRTIEAENGKVALEKYKSEHIDLIILDIMMPVVDGLDVCKVVRNSSNVLILMLTAKSEESDKLLGYELGADDYITKPFSLKVLVAKVKAMLKRVEISVPVTTGVYQVDGLTVNESSREVMLNSEYISFSPKEFDLLLYLLKNKGIVLSRDAILNSVWGYDYNGDLRAVDTHVRRVREKLKGMAQLIVTVVGVGYKFEVRNDKK